MRVTTSKSKNAESFYISKGYVNDKGVSTSVIIRKLQMIFMKPAASELIINS